MRTTVSLQLGTIRSDYPIYLSVAIDTNGRKIIQYALFGAELNSPKC